jgi:hypothetical protein
MFLVSISAVSQTPIFFAMSEAGVSCSLAVVFGQGVAKSLIHAFIHAFIDEDAHLGACE